MVAGEEAGVDVDVVDATGNAEPHDRPIAVRPCMPSRLPAVDHLAAKVVRTGHERGFRRVDQSFLEPERLVAGGDDAGPHKSRCKVHTMTIPAHHRPSPNAVDIGQ